MMKKIYLACPYSHPDPKVREARFRKVNEYAAQLLREGHLVFSPISHSHPIAVQCELPTEHTFWKKWNGSFIEWCNVLYVAALDGYLESEGVWWEMKTAKRKGKEVILQFITD